METPMEPVRLTRAEWNKIHRDYKISRPEYTAAFAGALPEGRTTATGTTLVLVIVEG